MIGRRRQSLGEIELPGDYYGPTVGMTGDVPAVFFLLPNAGLEPDLPARHSIHHVISPPHRFREFPDGSLEIRESIGADPHWHGYLDAGHSWRGVGKWA